MKKFNKTFNKNTNIYTIDLARSICHIFIAI